jgi:hypothetical protein
MSAIDTDNDSTGSVNANVCIDNLMLVSGGKRLRIFYQYFCWRVNALGVRLRKASNIYNNLKFCKFEPFFLVQREGEFKHLLINREEMFFT